MVIDSHEHIMFPTKVQLDKMNAAGVRPAIKSAGCPWRAGEKKFSQISANHRHFYLLRFCR